MRVVDDDGEVAPDVDVFEPAGNRRDGGEPAHDVVDGRAEGEGRCRGGE